VSATKKGKHHYCIPLVPETLTEILLCIKDHSNRFLSPEVSLGELTVHLKILKQHGLIVRRWGFFKRFDQYMLSNKAEPFLKHLITANAFAELERVVFQEKHIMPYDGY